MKKIRITLLTISTLLCISSYAFKEEGKEATRSFNGFATGEASLKLIYQSSEIENVLLEITDDENRILLTKRFKSTNGFNLPIKFREIATDEYNISLKTSGEVMKETVNVEDFRPSIGRDAFSIEMQNGKVALRSELLSNERTIIKISNAQGRLLHTDKLDMNQLFKRTYDLNQLHGEEVVFSAYVQDKLILQENFLP
ncbi:MAG: hypothetical protein AAF363_10405 [Bacteroidota bacterium]